MISKYTIYGERCSGTNYLEDLMTKNFDIELTWSYGWKHFFGFADLSNSQDTLFICIVRDIHTWLNSFYEIPYHWKYIRKNNDNKKDSFLNHTFYSIHERTRKEIMEDRHIHTGERYKNIFELRHTKIKYMIEELPLKVENYIFIRYEDLLMDFEKTMLKIKSKGIKVKDNIQFPVNSTNYKKNPRRTFKIKNYKHFQKNEIINNVNYQSYYEDLLYHGL